MPSPRLTSGDVGDEVARLHERLELHGLQVSTEERKRSFFGPSTREAVREFQKPHSVDPSGEVRENTAALLTGPPAAVPSRPYPASTQELIGDRRGLSSAFTGPPPPGSLTFVVQGQVTSNGFPVPGIMV